MDQSSVYEFVKLVLLNLKWHNQHVCTSAAYTLCNIHLSECMDSIRCFKIFIVGVWFKAQPWHSLLRLLHFIHFFAATQQPCGAAALISYKCHFPNLALQINGWRRVDLKDLQCSESVRERAFAGLYLTGLFALHDLKDGIFESVVDKGRGCGLHVLLHQSAGQRGRSEQCCGFVWWKHRRGSCKCKSM